MLKELKIGLTNEEGVKRLCYIMTKFWHNSNQLMNMQHEVY